MYFVNLHVIGCNTHQQHFHWSIYTCLDSSHQPFDVQTTKVVSSKMAEINMQNNEDYYKTAVYNVTPRPWTLCANYKHQSSPYRFCHSPITPMLAHIATKLRTPIANKSVINIQEPIERVGTPKCWMLSQLPFTTPLLLNLLDSVQAEAVITNNTEFVDLLQLIDEEVNDQDLLKTDSTCKGNNNGPKVKVNAENVVSKEPPKASAWHLTLTHRVPKNNPVLIRRRYRNKPLTNEERKHRQRKDRFTKPNASERKSQRSRKQVQRYQCL
ncbi:uncharacterized protein LOC127871886 isoform X1 [Dreissena polymorpha]|uniref:uncharacterized protein LOC127871886 isoform X1 n=2 Tax=Dreissena polymorpha TaxID=45954 RepID=UPI0022640CE2|nr:uncharacterized protein LOC127871886 isoform X1 [Dreissena polymorpha]